jgi:pyridoxamine 5'-phosphate oxidase
LNELTGRMQEITDEPFALFETWLGEATAREPNDPNAMALATVDEAGLPNVRMVLLKGYDHSGFVFYTNRESAKGRELDGQGKASANFHWKSLRRQVRIRGLIEQVSDQESDDYFKSRPRDSRIGAWASQQSRPMETRFALEKAVAYYAAQYAIGDVPRPPYWIGYRIKPLYIEFWQDKPFRLHERKVFRRASLEGSWHMDMLFP